MELIHADGSRDEIGLVRDIEKLDAEISGEQDATLPELSWELVLPDDVWEADPIEVGHFIYIPGTEFGGPVERVQHSTAQRIVTMEGPTWRGMLYRKIIEPPEGYAYMQISAQEANDALDTIIGTSMGDLFTVSEENSGINVTQDFRYTNMLLGIEKMLFEAGATLVLSYDQTTKSVLTSAQAVTDYTDTVDLSQDYGVEMISASGRIDG